MPYAIKYVSQRLGKELPMLPHINKSLKEDYIYETISSDTQTKKLVRQIYAEDYNRFGYGYMFE